VGQFSINTTTRHGEHVVHTLNLNLDYIEKTPNSYSTATAPTGAVVDANVTVNMSFGF
jgi:hypothetical protein